MESEDERSKYRRYVVCIHTEDSSEIEVRKIYEVLEDDIATRRGYLRIVDESGESYLSGC